jgi:hypothetical protein
MMSRIDSRHLEIVQCHESIPDIIIYPHMKWRWNRTMLYLGGIVAAILKMATGRNFSMRIESWHWTISTGRHFQNGHHNIAKNQHCTISSQFDMWVDNDVPNWFPTLKNFYRSLWWPFWKWRPVEIVQCQESIRDIIIYLHMKCRWNRTMLNLCGIIF